MNQKFRVHVIRPDKTQGIRYRTVINFPEGLSDEDAAKHARMLWEKQFPNETYPADGIEVVDKHERQVPRPGQFPMGVRAPE